MPASASSSAPASPDPLPTGPPLELVGAAGDDMQVRRGRGSFVRLEALADPVAPWTLRCAFVLMYVLLAALAAHQLVGWGGAASDTFFNVWVNNAILLGAAIATAWRAVTIRAERGAWWLVAAALFTYWSGDMVWTTFFAESDAAVTVADAFYLGFVPLLFLGIVGLVRSRIASFQLGRWIDGMAAALLVSAPGVVLVLEPTIRASEGSLLAKAVSVAYPMSDIILLGAVVGVIALAGWHPGRAWLLFALGLACFVAADSIYAVENLTGTYALGGFYEFLWPAAGLFIASAAWLRPLRHVEVHAWGLRAIALPILCQVAPISFMVMKDEPPSEQLIMTAVLTIVIVQLVVTRPRRPEHLA